jgi:glycosyltransferase involved in cell wall biosynthesis
MPPITAIIHTYNDELRLGRLLETLYPCDEVVIVDHESNDGTVRIAREYAATVVDASPGLSPSNYALQYPGWILCLESRESVSESLAASLLEWKCEELPTHAAGFSVFLREETTEGWLENPKPQMRLVPKSWNRWNGALPLEDPSSIALEGELLRFLFP